MPETNEEFVHVVPPIQAMNQHNGIRCGRGASTSCSTPDDERWIKSRAIDHSISAIVCCDESGRVMYVNKAFLSLWCFDRETEVVGRMASNFWNTDGYHGAAGRTLREKGGWIGELSAFKRNGEEFPVQISISFHPAMGERPSFYMASFIDITEQTRMRREQAITLRRLTERIKELDCILSIINCERSLSVSSRELLQNIAELIRASMQWPEKAYVRIVAGPIDVAAGECVDSASILHTPLGEEIGGFIDTGYAHDGDGPLILEEEKNLIGAVAREIESIIARQRIENELRINREKLVHAGKMASIGVLSAGIIHEMGNPNNFIALNARFLAKAWSSVLPVLELYYRENGAFAVAGLSYEEAVAEIPRCIEGILKGSERIRNIGEHLRTFVHASPQPHFSEIDMNSAISQALTFVNDMIATSVGRFAVHLGRDLPRISGDARQIGQVVINLLTNACQAVPSGSGTVALATAADGLGSVVVTIEDNGCGIEEQDIPRITDPFFSTRSEQGGTGLGLSVSKEIVSRHHGSMSFASRVGKGTKVTLTFPGVNHGE